MDNIQVGRLREKEKKMNVTGKRLLVNAFKVELKSRSHSLISADYVGKLVSGEFGGAYDTAEEAINTLGPEKLIYGKREKVPHS